MNVVTICSIRNKMCQYELKSKAMSYSHCLGTAFFVKPGNDFINSLLVLQKFTIARKRMLPFFCAVVK